MNMQIHDCVRMSAFSTGTCPTFLSRREWNYSALMHESHQPDLKESAKIRAKLYPTSRQPVSGLQYRTMQTCRLLNRAIHANFFPTTVKSLYYPLDINAYDMPGNTRRHS